MKKQDNSMARIILDLEDAWERQSPREHPGKIWAVLKDAAATFDEREARFNGRVAAFQELESPGGLLAAAIAGAKERTPHLTVRRATWSHQTGWTVEFA